MSYSELFHRSEEIYLNSGTMSRCPIEVIDYLQKEQLDYEKNPTKALFASYDRRWKIQSLLATFLNANPHDLYLRANVTQAINDFVFSYSWPKGCEILVSNVEYGACRNIVKQLCHKNELVLKEFVLPEDPDAPASEIIRCLLQSISPKTKGLLVSHVSTGNGRILPIKEIAEVLCARSIITMVDGAHAAGALDLNFKDFGNIDFYAANLHKWMMGPKGTGFGWINPNVRKEVVLNYGSWASFDFPSSFGNFGEKNQSTAELLVPGCIDNAPFYALEALLHFWNRLGKDAIRAEIFKKQQFLIDQVGKKLGWQMASPRNASIRGPLVAYWLPPALEKRGVSLISDLLEDIGVQINIPIYKNRPVIRFSPQIYTKENEIEIAIERLQKYKCRN